MPSATHRRIIFSSFHRLTLRAMRRREPFMFSTALVVAKVRRRAEARLRAPLLHSPPPHAPALDLFARSLDLVARSRDLLAHSAVPEPRSPAPSESALEKERRVAAPLRRAPAPLRRAPAPLRRAPAPLRRAPAPLRRARHLHVEISWTKGSVARSERSSARREIV
jgi:hypothetical protein